MKLKQFLHGALATLLVVAAASCSTDELTKKGTDPEGGTNADGTRTLKFRMEGLTIASGKTKAPDAGAIATDEENLVDDLILVLSVGNFADGQMEIWHYSKDNLDEPDGINKLLLAQNGKYLDGVVKTKLETAGETLHIAVYTNGLTFTSADNKPYSLPDFAAMVEDRTTLPTGMGTTLKNENGTYGTELIDPAVKLFTPPLPMMGGTDITDAGATTFALPLERLVARFDLQNQVENVRFLSITPLNVPANMQAMGLNDIEFIDKTPPVIVYNGTDYESPEAIASQKAASLFYTYPYKREEGQPTMTLEVKAVYRDELGNWTPKTYNLKLTRDGAEINIMQNTRYTIVITEATDQTLTSTIRIANWEMGSDLNGNLATDVATKTPQLGSFAGTNASLVPLNGQNMIVVDPIGTSSTVTFSVANYASDMGSDADNLLCDIVSADNDPTHIWLDANTGSGADYSFAVNATKVTELTDASITSLPDLIIRVKNAKNPANYQTVRVIPSWVRNDGTEKDRYGNAGTEADPYELKSTSDLLGFLAATNKKPTPNKFSSKFIELTNDIDLEGYELSNGASTNSNSSNKFTGKLDGNGHTVRNLKIKVNQTGASSSDVSVGLFAYTDRSTISNLSVTGTIEISTETTGKVFVGGIVGEGTGYITNCHSNVNITVDCSNSKIYENPNNPGLPMTGIGGVTGCCSVTNSLLQIRGCSNSGTITANHGFVGGIAGYTTGVITSYNTGNIRTTADCEAVGGIAGEIYYNTLNTNWRQSGIHNSYNTAVITGGTHTGGIIGSCYQQDNEGNIARKYDLVASDGSCYYNSETDSGTNPTGVAVPLSGMTGSQILEGLNKDIDQKTDNLGIGEKYKIFTSGGAGKYPILGKEESMQP